MLFLFPSIAVLFRIVVRLCYYYLQLVLGSVVGRILLFVLLPLFLEIRFLLRVRLLFELVLGLSSLVAQFALVVLFLNVGLAVRFAPGFLLVRFAQSHALGSVLGARCYGADRSGCGCVSHGGGGLWRFCVLVAVAKETGAKVRQKNEAKELRNGRISSFLEVRVQEGFSFSKFAAHQCRPGFQVYVSVQSTKYGRSILYSQATTIAS